MDKVRMGRALGYGARHAAKTMMQVVDAATTPAPRAPSVPAQPQTARPTPAFVEHLDQARQTVAHSHQEIKRAKRSIFAPFKEFSRTVGLQVAGVFFGIIAIVMVQGMWMRRQALHTSLTSTDAQKFYVEAFFFVLFAYFAISSFVHAARPASSGSK